jgi:hypothetical protein
LHYERDIFQILILLFWFHTLLVTLTPFRQKQKCHIHTILQKKVIFPPDAELSPSVL